jgi:hypothetical protein
MPSPASQQVRGLAGLRKSADQIRLQRRLSVEQPEDGLFAASRHHSAVFAQNTRKQPITTESDEWRPGRAQTTDCHGVQSTVAQCWNADGDGAAFPDTTSPNHDSHYGGAIGARRARQQQ